MPDPEDTRTDEERDLVNRIDAARLRYEAGMMDIAASAKAATEAAKAFSRAVQAVQDAEFERLRTHPDMLEFEVFTKSWYPA